MAIFANGRFVANDAWRLLGPDEAIAPDGPILVPLARFLAERETIIARGKPFGVVADAGEDVELLAPDLAAISRVVLNFPKYTDGRAYSSARLLRERHGYTGELCASGDVLHDQIPLMLRCGFDSFDVKHEPTIRALAEGRVRGVSVHYQTAGREGAEAVLKPAAALAAGFRGVRPRAGRAGARQPWGRKTLGRDDSGGKEHAGRTQCWPAGALSPAADTSSASDQRRLDARGLFQPLRHRQVLRFEELRVEQLGLVARAVVAEHGDDGVARAQLLGQPDGAGDVDAGGAAHAQPFLLQQLEADGTDFLVGDQVGAVDRRRPRCSW